MLARLSVLSYNKMSMWAIKKSDVMGEEVGYVD